MKAAILYIPDEYLDGLSLEDYLRRIEDADIRVITEEEELEVIVL